MKKKCFTGCAYNVFVKKKVSFVFPVIFPLWPNRWFLVFWSSSSEVREKLGVLAILSYEKSYACVPNIKEYAVCVYLICLLFSLNCLSSPPPAFKKMYARLKSTNRKLLFSFFFNLNVSFDLSYNYKHWNNNTPPTPRLRSDRLM